LDRFHKDEVSRSRTITRSRYVRRDHEPARLKLGSGLETHRCDVGSGIAASLRHLTHLFKYQLVIARWSDLSGTAFLNGKGEEQAEYDLGGIILHGYANR